MKKLLSLVLMLCLFATAAYSADAYKNYQDIVADPQSSPYYNYDRNKVADLVNELLKKVTNFSYNFYYKKSNEWFDPSDGGYAKNSNDDYLHFRIMGHEISSLYKELHTASLSEIQNPNSFSVFVDAYGVLSGAAQIIGMENSTRDSYYQKANSLKRRNRSQDFSDFLKDVRNGSTLFEEKATQQLASLMSNAVNTKLVGSFQTKEEKEKTVMAIAALEYRLETEGYVLYNEKMSASLWSDIKKVAEKNGYISKLDDTTKKK